MQSTCFLHLHILNVSAYPECLPHPLEDIVNDKRFLLYSNCQLAENRHVMCVVEKAVNDTLYRASETD